MQGNGHTNILSQLSHDLSIFRMLPPSYTKPVFNNGKRQGQTRGPSECEKWWKCITCHKVLLKDERKPENHQCGEYRCNSCEQYVLEDHMCYLWETSSSDNAEAKFIFYDFECSKDQIVQCSEGYMANVTENCTQCSIEEKCKSCSKCKNCIDDPVTPPSVAEIVVTWT